MIIFIQARMSSRRLPGKVLKNIDCYPILGWTIKRLSFLNGPKIVVITSKHPSDDPIIEYCKNQNIEFFRGSLNNVLLRFKKACEYFSEENFIRVCADSPFIDWKLIKIAISEYQNNSFDIVTNVLKRSFPKGQSVEILCSKSFKENFKFFEKKDLEHVTSFFYRNKAKFKIKNFKNSENFNNHSIALDTKKDLLQIKKLFFHFKDCHEYSFRKILKCKEKLRYEKN